jgi:3'(2'), 5'-bisphosphate nucleotidase
MAEFGEYAREISVLISIVTPLIPMSLEIFRNLKASCKETKNDGSLVTICDFALQSLIMKGISERLPGDKVLGEEDFTHIEPEFLEKVKQVLPAGFDPVEACKDAIKTIGPNDHRVWTCDPIDGTLGFVEGRDFAIALGLLVDFEPAVAVLGWPRHSSQLTGIPIDGPAIFVAARGKGAWAFDLSGKKFPVKTGDNPKDSFVFSDATGKIRPKAAEFMQKLGIKESLPMISITKGVVVGCGAAKAYASLHSGPVPHCVWDVVPVDLFVRESGGSVVTGNGAPVRYNPGGYVEDCKDGIWYIGGSKEWQKKAIDVVKEINGVK